MPPPLLLWEKINKTFINRLVFIFATKKLGRQHPKLGGVYLVKLHGNRCPDYEAGSLESHLNVNVAAVVPDPTFRIHNVQAHWSEEKKLFFPPTV